MLAQIFKKAHTILIRTGNGADEIKITIVICISNLGKTIDAGNEVDTAVSELKSLELTIALVVVTILLITGSFLPPRVVAELELNSVIPPPDIVEEER